MEKLFILLLAVPCILGATQQVCPLYFCDDITRYFAISSAMAANFTYCATTMQQLRTLADGNVVTWHEYSMKDCPLKNNLRQECPIDQLTQSGQITLCRQPADEVRPSSNLLPGQECQAAQECKSGSCSDSSCVGKTVETNCSSDEECDVGLYCPSCGTFCTKKCKPLVTEGGTCSKDTDCVQNNFCYQSVCRKWLSVGSGQEAPNSHPLACEYGVVESNRCLAPVLREQTEKNGDYAGEKKCTYKYVDGTVSSVQQDTLCGKAQSPSAFCPLGHGDAEYVTVLNLAKDLINANPEDCHTDIALACEKLQKRMPREVMAWNSIKEWPRTFPLMQDNPACVKYSVNYDYWYLYTGEYPAAS